MRNKHVIIFVSSNALKTRFQDILKCHHHPSKTHCSMSLFTEATVLLKQQQRADYI